MTDTHQKHTLGTGDAIVKKIELKFYTVLGMPGERSQLRHLPAVWPGGKSLDHSEPQFYFLKSNNSFRLMEA